MTAEEGANKNNNIAPEHIIELLKQAGVQPDISGRWVKTADLPKLIEYVCMLHAKYTDT